MKITHLKNGYVVARAYYKPNVYFVAYFKLDLIRPRPHVKYSEALLTEEIQFWLDHMISKQKTRYNNTNPQQQ